MGPLFLTIWNLDVSGFWISTVQPPLCPQICVYSGGLNMVQVLNDLDIAAPKGPTILNLKSLKIKQMVAILSKNIWKQTI